MLRVDGGLPADERHYPGLGGDGLLERAAGCGHVLTGLCLGGLVVAGLEVVARPCLAAGGAPVLLGLGLSACLAFQFGQARPVGLGAAGGLLLGGVDFGG